jgi:UDP-2,3-diacylglucosamine hydrolase
MELQAPPAWQCADFISDLHLQAADRPTFSAWAAYMQATQADCVFILGDLFEVWVGDDAALVAGSFEAECVAVLRQAGQRLALFIMQGNRDFLMGPALMQACNASALPDPSVLAFAGQRWLLSHGDALCLDDLDYQAFRKQVRSLDWQTAFLAKPLPERQAIARGIRQASASKKRSSTDYADLDSTAALALLDQGQATHLLHGHTHRPGQHRLAPERLRTVLSDWDLNATPQRAEVLRITLQSSGEPSISRLPVAALTETAIAGPTPPQPAIARPTD